ncbi:MAG: hypothetical protein M0Z67_02800 [Nitrospiraceae bacterium]|nr:hypothetical protein [Nitrospiraceae bacterium]
MPLRRDFKEYHKSIAEELRSTKDRIRNLIGAAHWQSDGEHKEAVLRKTLRLHLPETLHVGKGFVCCHDRTSSQTDILVTDRNKPTLFKDGELVLVTPDSVDAVIEVKTSLDGNAIEDVITKLADNVEMIRSEGNDHCKAGLFVYEKRGGHDIHKRVLEHLQLKSHGDLKRTINWLSFGPDIFFRFWEKGEDVHSPHGGPVWHSYELNDLGHAYFVSNVVWDVSRGNSLNMQFAWFPIEGGKERNRKWYVPLSNGAPTEFNH